MEVVFLQLAVHETENTGILVKSISCVVQSERGGSLSRNREASTLKLRNDTTKGDYRGKRTFP